MSQLFFLLLLLPILSWGRDQLDTIHVDGDKNPQSYSFGDTQFIDQKQIKQSGSPFLGELLKSVPSIMTVQNGGPGGRQSYFLRGTESRQLAFMLDHLKVNDPSNNDRHFDSAFTLTPDIEEVIVLKSPQPVLYGSDAIGGAIILKTRQGPKNNEDAGSLLSVGAGSFSSFQQTFQNDWRNKKTKGTLTASHYKTMGLSRLNKKRTKSRERDGSEIINIGSSSIHRWSKFETDLLVKYIHGQTDQDGYDNLGKNADTNDRSYNNQYLAQQKTRLKTQLGVVQLRQGLNRHHRRILTQSMGEETFSGNNLIHELTLVNRTGNFESTSGASYEHESFKDQSTDKAFDLSTAFAHGKYQLGPWQIHGGLRGDHHSRYGNFTSGSAGLSYQLSSLELFTQYAQGVKAPSLYQLYAPPSFGAPVGNKNLRPETNKTTEVGAKLKTENNDFVLTLFQNDLESQFTYISGIGYRNQDHFITQGAEANLTTYLTPGLRLQNSFTHQKFLAKDMPLRRPQNSAVSAIFWTPTEGLEIFWKERLISSRVDVDELGKRVKLNPYQVSSVGGHWIRGPYELTLTVENVFDREYEDIYATTVMPLSFWSNLSYRF